MGKPFNQRRDRGWAVHWVGVEYAPLGNGVYSAPAQLAGGFNGPAQSVNVPNTAPGQDLVVDSGASTGRTITTYNAANVQIGQIQFTYASSYEHDTGVDTILPLANGS